jgi:hypothetical protein
LISISEYLLVGIILKLNHWIDSRKKNFHES